MNKRNDARPALVLLALIVASTFIFTSVYVGQSEDISAEEDDGSSSGSGNESNSLENAKTITATGTCGSVNWTYNYSGSTARLTLQGSGTIPMASDSKWTVNTLTTDKGSLTGVSFYDVIRVTTSVSLVVDVNVSAAARAMSSLNPNSLSFTGSNGKIAEQTFLDCKRLVSVDLNGVSEVGAGAFKGCSMTSVTVGNAILNPTCFEDCNSLRTFNASGSVRYTTDRNGHYLLMDGGKTLFMCANGYTGTNGVAKDVPTTVTTVNLGYANVILAIDLKQYETLGAAPYVKFVDAVDKPKTIGFTYSSLGFTAAPSIAKTSKGVEISYTVLKGWAVDPSSAKISGNDASAIYGDGKVSLTFDGWCMFLPMGTVNLTYAQLNAMRDVGGWIVDATGIPERSDGATVGAINDPINVTIRGYNGQDGKATLAQTIYFYGIICHVERVEAKGGQMAALKELTIGPGIDVGPESFANCPNLVSVVGEDVKSVGDYAFQYCMNLKSVEFPNCTYFGEFAFGFCVELTDIILGSPNVEFEPTAIGGCVALNLIKVGLNDVVTGIKDATVLHYDTTSGIIVDLEGIGDYLYIVSDYGMEVKYYTSPGSTDVQTDKFYYTSTDLHVTLIPMPKGDFYIEVTPGPPEQNYLVIFNPGLGMDPREGFYSINGDQLITDIWTPSAWGYEFIGWQYDGKFYDFNRPVTSSMVFTAVWSRTNSIDSTPFYLLVIFLASIIATFVIVGITAKIR